MKLIRLREGEKRGLKQLEIMWRIATGKGLVQFLYKSYVKNEPPPPQDFLKLFRIDTKIAAIVDNDVRSICAMVYERSRKRQFKSCTNQARLQRVQHEPNTEKMAVRHL